MLILGGTGFIGPHFVHAAVRRGHKVSVFNRGTSPARLPAEVEILRGDRNGDLASIQRRDWDAVIDLSTYTPLWVRRLGEALASRVKHYTFISTVMTYARSTSVITEESCVLEYSESFDAYASPMPSGERKWIQYGSLKMLCEREAQAQFGERALIIRPGVITGPGDPTDHIAYWFARMERGGEILAPGDPTAPVQFIDARDLAEWSIRMAEKGQSGTYNAVGPPYGLSMAELMGAVRSKFSVPMWLTWLPSQWLIEQNLKADEVPFFWVKDPVWAEANELWLSYQVSSTKAYAKGLSCRSLEETISDNLTWHRTLSRHRQVTPASGWSAEVEQRLLAAWHASRRGRPYIMPSGRGSPNAGTLWALDNLHAWELANWDLVVRSPEERARLLERFGIKHYAYLDMVDPFGHTPDINTSQLDVDAEIEAMQKRRIDIRAWYFWLNTDDPAGDPKVTHALEAFKRHGIHPQIWVPQSFESSSSTLLNPQSKEGFPSSSREQAQRVQREAARIGAFARLAAPYGCTVNLYNHQGWFGMMENQLAILAHLREMGINDVGMVYNFPHSRSVHHDDAREFPQLWARIKPRVVAVNVFVFGKREVEMMQIIESSGWKGAVGVVTVFGNAELSLESTLWSLDWATTQLKRPVDV